jgi:DNA-binding CsgD family transcriptional regulator
MKSLGNASDSTPTKVPWFGVGEIQLPLPINVKLTRRETEVLKWISNGKTTWEISVILLVSQATIAFHVKNLMHKLGVHNRQQAIVVALKCQLIT